MTLLDYLIELRDNIKTWVTTNLILKVDKEDGKGLSTNDYTTEEKEKLGAVEKGANKYEHPTYTAQSGNPTENQTPVFGGTFTVSQPVSDEYGHTTEINSRTITIPNTKASSENDGLMSKEDWTKLNGIEEGANKTIVDDTLNETSENPVQNKVVNAALEDIRADVTTAIDDVNEKVEEKSRVEIIIWGAED